MSPKCNSETENLVLDSLSHLYFWTHYVTFYCTRGNGKMRAEGAQRRAGSEFGAAVHRVYSRVSNAWSLITGHWEQEVCTQVSI